MGVVPRRFFDVSMELKHPIAIEPEGGGQATGTLPDSEGGGHPGEWVSSQLKQPLKQPSLPIF